MTVARLPVPPVVLTATDGSQARVSPFGAHVLSWTTADGREQLYLSADAALDGSAPVRGGIPIIFPQFASEGPLPKHGFARTTPWQRARGGEPGGSEVEFVLRDTPETRAVWPQAFEASLVVTLGSGTLDVRLAVANTGEDALAFTAALHTYLGMDDAFGAEVLGLDGLTYRDSISREPGVQQNDVLSVRGAVNRVYANVPPRLTVRDGRRLVIIDSEGFPDAVVWNPGPEGEAALGDVPAGDARRMLCVEAAVVEQPVVLAAGGRWEGRTGLSVRGERFAVSG